MKHLENSLQDAKIELETDQTMLLRQQEVLEAEKQSMEQLDKKVGTWAQTADQLALRNEKHRKLKAAAERLVQKEEKIRERIEEQIRQRVQAEVEEARKRGQQEAKDDPEILRMAKLEAIRKAEQEEIEDDTKQINSMSSTLHKKRQGTQQQEAPATPQKENKSLHQDEPATKPATPAAH